VLRSSRSPFSAYETTGAPAFHFLPRASRFDPGTLLYSSRRGRTRTPYPYLSLARSASNPPCSCITRDFFVPTFRPPPKDPGLKERYHGCCPLYIVVRRHGWFLPPSSPDTQLVHVRIFLAPPVVADLYSIIPTPPFHPGPALPLLGVANAVDCLIVASIADWSRWHENRHAGYLPSVAGLPVATSVSTGYIHDRLVRPVIVRTIHHRTVQSARCSRAHLEP